MRIATGADRAGFQYKERLREHLAAEGHEVIDAGVKEEVVCDYPEFAEKAARLVANRECEYGILICGSGEGMAIAANKVSGIRCGIGYNDETAALLRQHNDANMIAFEARFMTYEEIEKRTEIFLATDFLQSYHTERVEMINKLEQKQ